MNEESGDRGAPWPRWVKVSGLSLVALVLLLAALYVWSENYVKCYDVDELLQSTEHPSAPFATFAELKESLRQRGVRVIVPTTDPPLQVWAEWYDHVQIRRQLAEFASVR